MKPLDPREPQDPLELPDESDPSDLSLDALRRRFPQVNTLSRDEQRRALRALGLGEPRQKAPERLLCGHELTHAKTSPSGEFTWCGKCGEGTPDASSGDRRRLAKCAQWVEEVRR
jgi:hypothetical protein